MMPSGHTYFVNYWCSEWGQSDKLIPAAARDLATQLQNLGAEVKVIPDIQMPLPTFPDPNVDYERDIVQFRLTSPKPLTAVDPVSAQARQLELQRLGFTVEITQDKALSAIPAAPKGDLLILAPFSSWSGRIFQGDQVLPAQLVLQAQGSSFQGELSFSWHSFKGPDLQYRVRVHGQAHLDTVTFVGEQLEGKYDPASYQAKYTSPPARLDGVWDNGKMTGRFEFLLEQQGDKDDG